MKIKFYFLLIGILFLITGKNFGASNFEKIQNNDSITLIQSTDKVIEIWKQNITLTAEQEILMRQNTIEYLAKRKKILGDVKNDSKKKLTEDQKKSLSEVGRSYREGIDTLLTEEQKAKLEYNREVKKATVNKIAEKSSPK
ncbi:hypothetical protein D0T53_10265 [Dysgonomonas sp. 216]|uniref:hypothetical protein n=1 Tax=Dysgonomonas sp. 216 TaxID=2302934 RepID=UPI0013D6AD3D|nr:hypothetical protein [Dysgonomonas sp. 216]NDW19295.1 hypothetical protein [Dysgonomonas sp. 216]